MPERRRNRRWPRQLEVRFWKQGEEGQGSRAISTNISRTGVFVRSKTPLAIGTKVNLRFTVIMDDIETIEGVGEVVRVHDDPAGMGVVFTELSGYSKSLIEKLLTNQARNLTGG